MQTVAKLITDAREKAGKSQRGLAAQLDRSNTLIVLWERGESLPNPHDIRQLASVLNIPLLTLLNAAQREAAARSMARYAEEPTSPESRLATAVA